MKSWKITGFGGVNNVKDPSALDQPKDDPSGVAFGDVGLRRCVNFDIDDDGGLVQRDATQAVFSEEFDAKLTQLLSGRTYTATANILSYTLPWKTEADPRRSAIRYNSPIVLIQEIEDGMWVSTTTEIVYHRGTNPTERGSFTQISKYDFPAIMGTGEKVHASKLGLEADEFVAIFATTKGICYGTAGGDLINISEGVFSYRPGQRGISYVKEDNGFIQYQVKMINSASSYNPWERKEAITIDNT